MVRTKIRPNQSLLVVYEETVYRIAGVLQADDPHATLVLQQVDGMGGASVPLFDLTGETEQPTYAVCANGLQAEDVASGTEEEVVAALAAHYGEEFEDLGETEYGVYLREVRIGGKVYTLWPLPNDARREAAPDHGRYLRLALDSNPGVGADHIRWAVRIGSRAVALAEYLNLTTEDAERLIKEVQDGS